MGGDDVHLMALLLQSDGRIDDEAFGAADAQIRVKEGDTHAVSSSEEGERGVRGRRLIMKRERGAGTKSERLYFFLSARRVRLGRRGSSRRGRAGRHRSMTS